MVTYLAGGSRPAIQPVNKQSSAPANPYRTALATTVRRDAPDPLRRPFRYHNIGASPAGRYGFLHGGTVPPTMQLDPTVAGRNGPWPRKGETPRRCGG